MMAAGGRSPAHLSGAATPSHEFARFTASMGPPSLTTCAQHPQSPGTATVVESLSRPLGLPAHYPRGTMNDADLNSGSNLGYVDNTPDLLNSFQQQHGLQAHIAPQQLLQNLGANSRAGDGLHGQGSGQVLEDLTDRIANLNMNNLHHQQHLLLRSQPTLGFSGESMVRQDGTYQASRAPDALRRTVLHLKFLPDILLAMSCIMCCQRACRRMLPGCQAR